MSVSDQSFELSPHETLATPRRDAGRQRLVPLAAVARPQWEGLIRRRLEGNGFFDPGFALAASALAKGGRALEAVTPDGEALRGLLPVVSAWKALRLPVPMLVAKLPYAVLSTPLLCASDAVGAAGALLDTAASAGAAVLMIPDLALEGPAARALTAAASQRGVAGTVDAVRQRALLDATADAEEYLRAGLGAKKLKELRRQANRMAEAGAVRFTMATTPVEIGMALDRFLVLEAAGWKGRRGTGLGQSAAEAEFIRRAALDMSARDNFVILELWLDDVVVAAGMVLRQGDHALFFKIAYDEHFSRFSPGVQLTVELTRRMCANPAIRVVDSSADQGHPMIDHVWRERLVVGDLYLPTGRRPALAQPVIGLAIARRRARQRLKNLYHRVPTLREKRP